MSKSERERGSAPSQKSGPSLPLEERVKREKWPERMPVDTSISVPPGPDAPRSAKLSEEARANHRLWRDRALGCSLGAATADAFLGDGGFGSATILAVLEAEAFLEAGDVEAARPAMFQRFKDWCESEPSDLTNVQSWVLVGWRPFEGAAARRFSQYPNHEAESACLTSSAYSAARWAFGKNPQGSAFVARRFASVVHGHPSAGEARALLTPDRLPTT